MNKLTVAEASRVVNLIPTRLLIDLCRHECISESFLSVSFAKKYISDPQYLELFWAEPNRNLNNDCRLAKLYDVTDDCKKSKLVEFFASKYISSLRSKTHMHETTVFIKCLAMESNFTDEEIIRKIRNHYYSSSANYIEMLDLSRIEFSKMLAYRKKLAEYSDYLTEDLLKEIPLRLVSTGDLYRLLERIPAEVLESYGAAALEKVYNVYPYSGFKNFMWFFAENKRFLDFKTPAVVRLFFESNPEEYIPLINDLTQEDLDRMCLTSKHLLLLASRHEVALKDSTIEFLKRGFMVEVISGQSSVSKYTTGALGELKNAARTKELQSDESGGITD